MSEKWRDIPEFKGVFQVSNMGRIKRIGGNRAGRRNAEGLMKPYWREAHGYLIAQLVHRRKLHHIVLAKLVLEAFTGSTGEYCKIVYRNGDKQDCRLDNLEYQPTQEFLRALERGREIVTRKMRSGRFTEDDINFITQSKLKGRELAIMFNVHESTISRIRNHERDSIAATAIDRIRQRLFELVYYDLETASQLIGCNANTLLCRCIYGTVKDGKLPHVKIGNQYFISQQELYRIINSKLLDRRHPAEYNGRHYKSIAEAAKNNNVHEETMRGIIKRRGVIQGKLKHIRRQR